MKYIATQKLRCKAFDLPKRTLEFNEGDDVTHLTDYLENWLKTGRVKEVKPHAKKETKVVKEIETKEEKPAPKKRTYRKRAKK